MENIPDPKYKIGDVVMVFNEQKKIDSAYYSFKEEIWKYYEKTFGKDRFFITEDQIIKKLN